MLATFYVENDGNLNRSNIECEPSVFYAEMADFLSSQEAGSIVEVSTSYGDARFQLIPSAGHFFIREEYNNINITSDEWLKPVYLTKIDPQYNNYKFYRLEQISDDTIRATYGRIGAKANELFGTRTHDYPKRMFFVKLAEKLKKGYLSQSDIYLGDQKGNESKNKSPKQIKQNIPENPSQILYNTLLRFSKQYITEHCVSTIVTEKMVKESRKLIKYLYRLKTVKAFNRTLMKLMVISPRRLKNVNDYLAKFPSDFSNILLHEESLANSMEAVLKSQNPQKQNKILDFGEDVEVYIATNEQKQQVMNRLSDVLKGKVKEIYRVIPKKQQKSFNDYIKAKNIVDIKQFWHGSKNCNWLSIIDNGLLLNPNAEITAKMWGNGIYFAPTSLKSWGYTSYKGTCWANGKSDTAFMGLYACAYGRPYYPSGLVKCSQSMLDSMHCDCLHAKSGTAFLKNDEIVFYNESAMVLNYIVEFK